MPTDQAKFLLVDDLEENLLALEATLRRDGLKLFRARSGPEALELLLQHDFALAILDVQMPGMDGFELAEFMRGTERTRRVPIIFLTAGNTDERRRFRGYESGAVDFLFKPVEPMILRGKCEVFFELYQQRREVARAKEAAEAANAAKDLFLAVLSHELRTPLAPVRMTIDLWERGRRLPPELRDDLAMIRRNVDLECRLIDDLLDVNRIANGKLQLDLKRLELGQVIRHAVHTVSADAKSKGVQVTFDDQAPGAAVEGDEGRLQQLLWNLLRNAVKFTPAGGSIRVNTQRLPGRRVRISVSDTGIGIEPAALGRIFNAFEQGDARINRQFGGLGLGLAISKAVAELHHGTLRAESAGLGHGATFNLELATVDAPAPAQPALQPSAAPSPDDAKPTGRARILLVEDHTDTALMMQRLLNASGYDVHTAGGVAQAVNAWSASPFDLLISDLGLPDGTGHELLRRLLKTGPVKAIALSGYGMEDEIERGRQAGFAAHLIKPADFDALLTAVQKLGDAHPPR